MNTLRPTTSGEPHAVGGPAGGGAPPAAWEWLRAIIDHTTAVITVKDRDGRHLLVNRRFEEVYGVPRHQALGKTDRDLFPPEAAAALAARDREVMAAGGSFEYEEAVPGPGGGRAFLAVKFPLRDAAGRVAGVCGIATDITDRKRAEDRLRREKEFTERLIASSLDGILAFDADCRYTAWNPAMERLTGLPADRVLGRRAFDLFPFLTETGEDRFIRDALAGKPGVSHDRPFRVPESGREGFFEGHYSPVTDEAGRVVGGLAVVRDVTDRRRAEGERVRLAAEQAARAEAEAAARRFAFLAEAGEALSSSLDYEQTLREVARLALPTLGDFCIVDVVEAGAVRRVAAAHVRPEKAELLDELRRRYPPDPNSPQPAARVLRTGEPELLTDVDPGVVAAHTRGDDHARLIRAIGIRSHLAVPLVARGQTVGAISLGLTESDRRYGEADVALARELARRAALAVDNARLYRAAQDELAERRRAEEARRASEERFRAVMEQSPLSTQIFAADGTPVRVNRAWEALWGVKLDQIPEYNILADPQLEARGVAPFIRRAFAGEAVEIPAIRYDPNETIPDRSRHDDPVRWVRAFAYPVTDAAGRVREVVLVHEDVTARVVAEENLRRGEERLQLAVEIAQMGTFEIDLRTDAVTVNEPGRAIYGWDSPHTTFARVQTHFHPDDKEEVLRRVAAAFDPAGPGAFEVEQRIVRTDGAVRWIRVRGRAFFAGEGVDRRAVRCLGTYVDVTDRKKAEEALREQDRRKDEFLATLAHELRNPLAPIRNGLQILAHLPDGAAAAKVRGMMERQLAHTVRLIDDLLDVSRITTGKVTLRRERVPLQAVAELGVEASRPQIEAARHALTLDLPDEPVWVYADVTRVAQVVSNLLTNAAKYTPEGGRITLAVGRDGGSALVRVTDTGLGIPGELLGEVFEMFTQVNRTLDRAQGGLGIGLALVKRLVELHGGTIAAESPGPGRGSTFTVRLPLAAEPAGLPEPPPPPAAPGGAARFRVLVVDDNRDAADTLAVLLELAGHDARAAYAGPDALDAARAVRPDVAFLDLGLPGMDGYELARRLRAEPGLAGTVLVAVTGWGSPEDRQKTAAAGFAHHLTKPADAAHVQEILLGLAGKTPAGPG